jgi:hypothetical protein
MASYDIRFYNVDPLGIFSGTVGNTGTWSGTTIPDATGTITDSAAGIEGLSLDDTPGETATIDSVIGGSSATNSSIYAEEVWTVTDNVTGVTFQIATLRISDGTNIGYYTYSEIPLVNGRSYTTDAYTENPEVGVTDVFSFQDYVAFADPGVVQGTAGNDVIDNTYTGDPDGDVVDLVIPDTPLQFNWSDYADETNLEAGVTQNAGGINVAVTYADPNVVDEFSAELSGGVNDAVYVAPGEPFSTTSAGYLRGEGAVEDTLLVFDFSSTGGSGFNDEVENVQFRISDIDGLSDGTNNFQDIVTIQAFNANGDPVTVNITGGSNLTVDPATGTITAALTNFTPSSVEASALIEIPGPVSQIVVSYDNGGTTAQAIYFTDIHFDAVADVDLDDIIEAGEGDDIITGGEGADTVFGGAGNDTITVGTGDNAIGGDGDDTFIVDTAQIGGGVITVEGSETDESPTGDTLNFNGQLQFGTLTYSVPATDPGGASGTATLLDGTVVNFSNIENVLCFVEGMLIDTPFGPRPVEDLNEGDLVLTRDSGPQAIRWHGCRSLVAPKEMAPVEFSAGLLGNARAFRVSPQHRLLNAGYRAQLNFGQDEVLVPAKSLVNGTTVRQLDAGSVTYHHLLFDQHEIINCDGIPSESYHPGHYSLPGLGDEASEDLFRVFPELRSDPSAYGRPAREAVKPSLGHVLAA